MIVWQWGLPHLHDSISIHQDGDLVCTTVLLDSHGCFIVWIGLVCAVPRCRDGDTLSSHKLHLTRYTL